MKNKYNIIRKVRRSGTSLAINLPKEITEIMKIKEGELIELEIRKILR